MLAKLNMRSIESMGLSRVGEINVNVPIMRKINFFVVVKLMIKLKQGIWKHEISVTIIT